MAPATAKFRRTEKLLSDGEETEDETTEMISSSVLASVPGYSNQKLPASLSLDRGRFVVSPVRFQTEKQPLLRVDSQTSDYALSPKIEDRELVKNISILVPGREVSSADSLGDEDFVDALVNRYRHASSVSKVSDAATIDTFLDEDEPTLSQLTLDIPVAAHVQGKTAKGQLITGAEGAMLSHPHAQPYYDNAALNFIPSPSENPYHDNNTSTEISPEVIYSRAPPVPIILTSHASDTSLSHHHPPESVEVSRWDLGPASRNPDIQFYVGSCLSVTSATSAVSFFNTLYAHGYMPICRICHQPASEKRPLTSPCKCVGSLRFIHQSCLMRWIDTRSRQLRHSPKCELCGYQFRARRTWRAWKSIAWPVIPLRDKIFHGIFISSVVLMCVCVGVISMVLKRDNTLTRSGSGKEKAGLTETEMATLSCGVLFFVSFFAAMIAQIKANWSLWKLTRLFFEANYVLQIERDRSASATVAERTVLKV